ncbi:DUF5691 domain-containing protein [Pseudanabaena sp. PCC 6802]|uniref:DUF5691 domain-containing protein n=1 Tax=Pseudanabaena sp. PCC 6802 TaxID=118173 RepID=UPI00034CF202|nr:DUF5691 domain-containing protein [Pseudanabaena sp. PCC 6802]
MLAIDAKIMGQMLNPCVNAYHQTLNPYHPTPTMLQNIVATALIGTERQPFTPPIADGKLGELIAKIDPANPETALLSVAAAITLHHKLGQKLKTTDIPLPQPCDLEDLPCCSDRAAYYLQLILSDTNRANLEILPEFVRAVAKMGQRVPETSLERLLSLGKALGDLHAAIVPVLGKRGIWLAAQNPEWNYVTVDDRETVWETGNLKERLIWFRVQRQRDANRAREYLEGTWKSETAGDRSKFLETLEIGLSMVDEPFLESALDDRSKEVRRVAAEHLSCLPESRLCQRMTERVKSALEIVSKKGESFFQVTLSEVGDKSTIRDGIEPKSQDSKLGDKSWWLQQMLASTPLSLWAQIWSKTPSELMEVAQHKRSDEIVLRGLALAASRQKDIAWIEAIFTSNAASILQPLMPNIYQMFKSLPYERQEAIALEAIKSQGVTSNLAGILLFKDKAIWSGGVTQVALDSFKQEIEQNNNRYDRRLDPFLWGCARYMAPTQIHQLVALLSDTRQQVEQSETTEYNDYVKNSILRTIDESLGIVKLRQEMLEAINNG